jgi:protein-disulfide isomerase
MSSIASLVRLTALALLIAACSKQDAAKTPPAAAKGAAGGEVAAAAPANGGGMAPNLTDSISTRADKGRIRGSDNAPVWLIEISDFQCPFCKQWHDETYAALDKEYVQTGKVRLAYLNYPIAQIHPNAPAAAEAAMCAAVQGKFWEMHTALFSKQQQWAKEQDPMPIFASFAVSAGVDPKSWNTCMTTHATKALIDADHQRSGSAGVQSTPSFFITNVAAKTTRQILGAQPVDSFRVAINAQLAPAPAR